MTVLSSETELWTAQSALPRVNLMPPEIAERRAMRRVQVGLGATAAGAVAVVALLTVSASHGVTSAQEDLATQQKQTTQLQSQIARYGSVQQTYAAASAARAQLGIAMADEIRFSQLMNDLSLTIPSNVWVSSVAFSKGAVGREAPVPGASVGKLTVNGVAFSHDDVALWLEAVAGLSTYTNTYFSNSTEGLIGTRPVVNFSSSAEVTPVAVTGGRFLRQLGSQ